MSSTCLCLLGKSFGKCREPASTRQKAKNAFKVPLTHTAEISRLFWESAYPIFLLKYLKTALVLKSSMFCYYEYIMKLLPLWTRELEHLESALLDYSHSHLPLEEAISYPLWGESYAFVFTVSSKNKGRERSHRLKILIVINSETQREDTGVQLAKVRTPNASTYELHYLESTCPRVTFSVGGRSNLLLCCSSIHEACPLGDSRMFSGLLRKLSRFSKYLLIPKHQAKCWILQQWTDYE